jgi:hypothetical protein
MARIRPAELGTAPFHRTLSTPGVFLARMTIFLTLVALIAAILSDQLFNAFRQNPFLNGMIVAALFVGVFYMFGQVVRLFPEIRWVNAFRIADPGLAVTHRPVLLAPMATMLRDRTGSLQLSTAAMRTIMDSIASRLDEARDTGRYLVGLMVFLGLLGTFWGLLETISSVSRVIGALDTKASDSVLVFEELKSGLAAPLRGMGTAFASSLLGLAGSLVLGFLDLQVSQSHNRFYNELEEWLSGITELTPGAAPGDVGNRQLYIAIADLNRTIGSLAERVTSSGGDPALTHGVQQLVTQMRSEQQVVRQWLDEQSNQATSRHDDVSQRLEALQQTLGRR